MSGEGILSVCGRSLSYPTRFRDGAAVLGLFPARTAAVRSLFGDVPFEPAEIVPGRCLCSINCVHYVDTDCGTYDEVALACFVRPVPVRGARYVGDWRRILTGREPAYTWWLAVSTELSQQAGRQMWGFPKEMGDLSWRRDPHSVTMHCAIDGSDVLRFTAPTSGRRRPRPIASPVYSVLDGRPVVSHLTQRFSGTGYHRRGASLELGDHAVARTLRDLGVTRPSLTVWNEHLEFEMSSPEPLEAHAGSME